MHGKTSRRVWDAWPVFCARYYARQTWEGLPGPWPVKVALLVVCALIPGPQDELVLVALTQVCRARAPRKAAVV